MAYTLSAETAKENLSENKPQKESQLETGQWGLSTLEYLSYSLQGASCCPEYFFVTLALQRAQTVLFIA